MKSMHNSKSLIPSEEGATAVEYAIMAGLIAAVIAGSVKFFGETIIKLFESVNF